MLFRSCGTTPMLTLSHTFNRTEAGILLSVTNKITLNGKIYDRNNASSGIQFVLNKETELRNLFKNCSMNTLDVKCGCSGHNTGCTNVISFSGVQIRSITTDSSPDFLTKSMGYTIELENIEGSSSSDASIVSASDSWNIEPIADDYVYENFQINTSTRPEYHNPNNPGAAPSNTSPLNSSQITIQQIPQFKVSRKLSARAVLSSSVSCSGSGHYGAYLNAREWVAKRLNSPWQASGASGLYLGGAFTVSSMNTNQMFVFILLRMLQKVYLRLFVITTIAIILFALQI